jgi:hypothetical protein
LPQHNSSPVAFAAAIVGAGLLAALPALAETSAPAPSAPVATATAEGGAGSTVEFVWTVHLGGMTLGTVGFKGSFNGDTYSAVSRLKTSGVINSFYAAVIDAGSTGWLRGSHIEPTKYDSNYEGEKSKQRVALAYSTSGINLFADPAYDVKKYPVSDEQKKDTVDPLSGIVQTVAGVTVSENNPCGDTVQVFDGRRRYDMNMTFVSKEELSSDSGGYSGPAALCEMEYKQIAGFKPNLNKGKELPKIQVWFAKFPAKTGGPIREFVVPVKVQSETPFGMAVGNARNIAVDGAKKG